MRQSAPAANLAFSRNARTFETVQSSLFVKSVAHACLGLIEVPDGPPCNPAFVPLQARARLGAEFLLSNGYPALQKMQQLLRGDIDQNLVDTLFSNQRVLQIEGNAELNFYSKFLVSRYAPVSVKFFSVVRNEANPLIDLYAVQDQSMLLQTGYKIGYGFSVGAQARQIQRKFIRRQFKLLDVATQTGRDRLKPKEQSLLYFEPSLGYKSSTTWPLTAGLMLVNLGTASVVYDELNEESQVQAGIALGAPIPYGQFRVMVDYKNLAPNEQESEKFRVGAMYSFGAMNLGAGADYNGLSWGLYYGVQQIHAGIMYSTTSTPWTNSDFYTQTVYLQVGWEI